jgi:phosphatidylglycerophosphatase C
VSTKPTVVVFDFDLTLTRWDTADRFFRWLLKRDAWRLGLVIASLPVFGPLLLFRATRRWFIRFAVWVATLGRTPEVLPSLVDEYLRSLPGGCASAFLPVALEQLQSHVAQGHRVVIATGSLEPVAQALLSEVGLGRHSPRRVHAPAVPGRTGAR